MSTGDDATDGTPDDGTATGASDPDDGGLGDRLPLVRGGLAGAGAYLVGYLLTYLLAGERVRESALTGLLDFFAGEPTTWKVVGWLFYNAHMVSVVVPGFAGSRTVDLLAEAGGRATLLYLVPPLLLTAAGVLAARDGGERDAAAGAKAGATAVLGYLPLAVLGAFVFTVQAGGATIRPDVVTALALAGLLYPVAFGALGGALGSR